MTCESVQNFRSCLYTRHAVLLPASLLNAAVVAMGMEFVLCLDMMSDHTVPSWTESKLSKLN